MKTKSFFIAAILLSFSLTYLNAQGIDSLAIIPKYPTTNDSIKIISYIGSPTSYCSLDSSSIDLKEDTITVLAWHKQGIMNMVCYSTDTISIGKLSSGTYELHYNLTGSYSQKSYDIDTIAFTVQLPSTEDYKVIEPGKRWIYAWGRTVPTPEVDRHEALFIGEDTVISNHKYYELFSKNTDTEQIRLLGFIRETENKRIFYLPVKEEKEELLYDFNLAPGDSIYLDRYPAYLYMDSVKINNNGKKVYYVRLGLSNIQWIENVGSNIGLLMMELVGGFRIFTCCYKGDSLIYRNPRFRSCDITKMEYLVSENKFWSNVIHYKANPGIGSEFLKLSGDTVIDKGIYKEVLCSTDEQQSTWNHCGFIRNTLEQKVYYRADTSKQEYLLYDFSAQLNDTLKLYRLFTGQKQELKELTFRVTKIDSIVIGNEYRKQFEITSLNEPDYKEYFIEGIGSLSGLLYWKGGFAGMDEYELNCFFEDSVLTYHNEEYPSCYYTRTSAEQISKDETLINIIPIGNETVIVRSLSGGGGILQIYDITGKVIVHKTLKSDETQICLPASGVYICHFRSDKGKFQIGKFVVN